MKPVAATAETYALPQEFVDFRDTIRQMVDERVRPRAAEIDATGEYPWDVRKLFAEHDLLGLPFPTEYGGTGTGTLMLNVAVEEVAKACASSALILMVQELGTLPIQLFGTDEQKERFLPRCASGELSPAFCLSEPEAGSDPASMRTTARRDGDEWVLNGTKNWITNAGIADFYIVFAMTDTEQRKASAFIVEKERPGSRCRSSSTSSASAARPPASRCSRTCAFPQENLLGPEGRGLKVALSTLSARASARRPRRSGSPRARPTTPPVRKGADRVRQADHRAAGHPVQAGRHADQDGRRARAAVQGVRDGRSRRAGLRMYSSMAKLFASDTAMEVTVEAVQVLGGYGYVTEYPVERMMRDAKITQIYEGTNEIQRVVIAGAMR